MEEELKRKIEKLNKLLIKTEYILVTVLVIFYVGIVVYGGELTTKENEHLYLIVCIVSTILFLIVAFYSLKIECEAGYYECKVCKTKFKSNYKDVLISAHMGTTRYLKCPNCNKRHWAKKYLKED